MHATELRLNKQSGKFQENLRCDASKTGAMKGSLGSQEGVEPNASAGWLAIAQLLTASQSDVT
jgi:hypothetical protein